MSRCRRRHRSCRRGATKRYGRACRSHPRGLPFRQRIYARQDLLGEGRRREAFDHRLARGRPAPARLAWLGEGGAQQGAEMRDVWLGLR
jgi:hypothetical protein